MIGGGKRPASTMARNVKALIPKTVQTFEPVKRRRPKSVCFIVLLNKGGRGVGKCQTDSARLRLRRLSMAEKADTADGVTALEALLCALEPLSRLSEDREGGSATEFVNRGSATTPLRCHPNAGVAALKQNRLANRGTEVLL